MQTKFILIDPASLTDEQAKLLHVFLIENEKTDISQIHKNIEYGCLSNPEGRFKLTENLIRTSRKINDKIIYYYTFYSSFLGQGAFGEVYEGKTLIHKNDKMVLESTNIAIKRQKINLPENIWNNKEAIAEFSKEKLQLQLRENKIMEKIVYMGNRGIAIFQEGKILLVYTVMNKIEGIELTKFLNSPSDTSYEYEKMSCVLKKLSSQDLLKSLMNLLVTLNVVTQAEVIHNDIKFENVIINVAKHMSMILIDFGVSFYKENSKSNFGGSPLFMSPEKVYFYGKDKVFDQKSDVYSLGIMFRILCGDNNLINYFIAAQKKGLKPFLLALTRQYEENEPIDLTFSDEFIEKLQKSGVKYKLLADLLLRMTAPNPEDRPSADQALKEFIDLFSQKKQIKTMYMINSRAGFFKFPKHILNNILDKSGTLIGCFESEMYGHLSRGSHK